MPDGGSSDNNDPFNDDDDMDRPANEDTCKLDHNYVGGEDHPAVNHFTTASTSSKARVKNGP
jgi:hypothetical protein